MTLSWTVKYMPKNTSEVVSQNKALASLREYVTNYSKQRKKSALVYGPTGTGKTCSVYALAKELDWEVIEVNASDVRNEEEIRKRLGPAINQMSLFSGGKIILIDELDGISGTKDRGGINTIIKLMEKSTFPIVLTANDPWNKKFSGIRRKSELIEFHSLAYPSISSGLRSICKKEGVEYDEETLKSLARRAGGDLRAAITDLQILTQDGKKLSKEQLEELSPRKQTDSIISALTRIFKTTNPNVALSAFNDLDENQDEIFLWMDENIPKEYTKPGDLYKAYEMVSKADIFKRRITRWQYYRFMVYIFQFLSAGVALSKEEKYKGFTQYKPTSRILKIWKANMKYQKRKSIAGKIARNNHVSIKEAVKEVAYYKLMFKNRNLGDSIARELNLDSAEVEWLRR